MNKKYSFLSILLFWSLFFCLNGLLSIPAFLVDSQFINPTLAEETTSSLGQTISSGNVKILFRWCGEFLLLFLPLIFLPKRKWLTSTYTSLAAFAYLFLLYYKCYFFGYKAAYSVHPIFANDWVIVKEVLPTFLREVSVKGSTYLLSIVAFVGLSTGLVILLGFQFRQLRQLQKLPIFWGIGAFLFATTGVSFFENAPIIQNEIIDSDQAEKGDSIIQKTYNWVHWTTPDIQKSAHLNREDHLQHLKKRWLYDFYKTKPLVQKPNIYLIFLESYGGVASLSDYCAPLYDTLSAHLHETLDSAGWSVVSNYSKSTVIGGRSWLAMTTAMVGARIEDQIQYSELIKKEMGYPHMVDFFNRQGYETVRMSNMRINEIDTLNMLTIPNRFWQFDRRYLFPDIPYRGYQYDYYGGIPDQFALGYANDNWLTNPEQPYFFTSITMNSHGPWQSRMPPIVEDYHTLNTLENPFGGETTEADMTIKKYWTAVDYQLRMIADFVLKKGKDNSVYIFMGDHNPGGLEYKLYKRFNKWATPIHIISRDSNFTQSFIQHGFTEGIKVDTSQFTIMRHMGLYSLLTRQLLENYGEKEELLPDYLPWGL
ncbi:MAG: sulfatase-like hydrolase/transferase [Bacteroidota bacterium]